MILSTKAVNFGTSKTGLATVGYRLLNNDGVEQLARTTTGVVETLTGTGIYQAEISFPENWNGTILWDTGEGTPKYAAETFDVRAIDATTRFPVVAPGGVEKQTWTSKDKKQNFEILSKIMEVLAEIKTLHAGHSAILSQISSAMISRQDAVPVLESLTVSIKTLQENQKQSIEMTETMIESQVAILEAQEVHETIEGDEDEQTNGTEE